MKTVRETIKDSTYILKRSLNTSELKSALLSLTNAKKLGLDDETNLEIDGLNYQIAIKYYLLLFIKNDFDKEHFDMLLSNLNKISLMAKDKGLNKTSEWASNSIELSKEIYSISCDISVYLNQLVDSEGNVLIKSIAEADNLIGVFDQKIEKVDSIKHYNVFDEYKKQGLNIDLKVSLKELLVKKANSVKQIKHSIGEKIENDIFKKYAKNIEEIYSNFYEYAPTIDEKNKTAKLMVINSPFKEDVELFIRNYKNKTGDNLLCIDSELLNNLPKESIDSIFGLLSLKKCTLYVYNVNKVHSSSRDSLYNALLEFAKDDNKVFVHDNSGLNTIYKDLFGISSRSEKFSIMNVSFEYLSIPKFSDLVNNILIPEKLIPDDSSESLLLVQKTMLLVGFDGLNKVLHEAKIGGDWVEKAKSICRNNLNDTVIKYIENIPNLFLFIDSAWRYEGYEYKVNNQRIKFNYDDIKGVNVENIKKIIDSGYNFFQKAGMLVKYCLLHGDDESIWETLEIEDYVERLNLATTQLYKLFELDFIPVIEVKEELINAEAGGVCCDGGKLVQYKLSSIKSFEFAYDVVLHETYHSFQRYAEATPYKEWFFTELGVTKGRIEQWRLNEQCYFDLKKGKQSFNAYRVQTIESEAYAFSVDAMGQAGECWHLLDLE